MAAIPRKYNLHSDYSRGMVHGCHSKKYNLQSHYYRGMVMAAIPKEYYLQSDSHLFKVPRHNNNDYGLMKDLLVKGFYTLGKTIVFNVKRAP